MQIDQTIDRQCPFDQVAANILYATKPDHWLIQFLAPSQAVWEDYLEIFSHPNVPKEERCLEASLAYNAEKYSQALRWACEHPDGPVIIHHEGPLDGWYLLH